MHGILVVERGAFPVDPDNGCEEDDSLGCVSIWTVVESHCFYTFFSVLWRMAHCFLRLFHLVRSSLLVCPGRPHFQVCHPNCIMDRHPGQLCQLWRHWQRACLISPQASCAVGEETPLSHSEVYYLWLADTRMPGAFDSCNALLIVSHFLSVPTRCVSSREGILAHARVGSPTRLTLRKVGHYS